MITVGLYGIADTTCGAQPTHVHDHGLAILRAGQVLTAIQLERVTGRKHDNRMPEHIGGLLARHLPANEPVRFVSVNTFLGDSFVSNDGNFRIEPEERLSIEGIVVRARLRWFHDGLHRQAADGYVMCHEFAHLASLLPFVGAFEPGALLAHIDGGASDSASSFWTWDGRRPKLLERSWERLKAVVNNFNANPLVRAMLGFNAADHLAMPGKLMGYAGLGMPTERTIDWLQKEHYFLDRDDDTPSVRVALLDEVNRHFGTRFAVFDPRCRELAEIAASLQAVFERQVVQTLAQWKQATGARVLYLAGGAALNIPTNARLERLFDRVYVPPCTSDAGLALGAAAWLEYVERGELPIHSPFLNAFAVPLHEPPLDAVDEVVRLLLDQAVIGVCNGAAEIGPRALGHRSILARADNPDLRRRVSEELKGREWYRPIAPVLCDEAAQKVLGAAVAQSPLARYMLGAWPVRPGWEAGLAGVLHRDGTVRAQVVSARDPDNRFLYELLIRLWREHGVPALINTSFNVRGQPILHHHEDAIPAACSMGLDAVVIHGSLHRLRSTRR